MAMWSGEELSLGKDSVLFLVQTCHFLGELPKYRVQSTFKEVVTILDANSVCLRLEYLPEQVLQVDSLQILLNHEHNGEIGCEEGDTLLIVSLI